MPGLGAVVVLLAALNVAFLVGLPALSSVAAGQLDEPRPPELPRQPRPPERLDEPVAPIEELREELRLPRVDESPGDEHTRAMLEAYREGDYERAFDESVLALDPTPLEENALYEAITTVKFGSPDLIVEKPNGREAVKQVDEALRPVLEREDPDTAARLNNAAAMLVLRVHARDQPEVSSGSGNEGFTPELAEKIELYRGKAIAAEELAWQAADLAPSSCAALLNLTLLNGRGHAGPELYPVVGWEPDNAAYWSEHYSAEGCGEPALLYHLAQRYAIDGEDAERSRELVEELARDDRWEGLAHSVMGDVYYWRGIYSLKRAPGGYQNGYQQALQKKPFTARRYFEMARDEYEAALKLQPDDPAIHNGLALVHLELGQQKEALHEAGEAFESVPRSPRLYETLIRVHEEMGGFAEAARLGRELIEDEPSPPTEPALVPYSAISHGAGLYSEFWTPLEGGAGVFVDDEVIPRFVNSRFVSSKEITSSFSVSAGLGRFYEAPKYHGLLRADFLGGDPEALEEDLAIVPKEIKGGDHALLLGALDRLLGQPGGATAPDEATRVAVDAFLEAYTRSANVSMPKTYGDFYYEAGNLLRRYGRYEDALRVYDVWKIELRAEKADARNLSYAESLRGEALFLGGRSEEALVAFERARELYPWAPYTVRTAFMHEQLGEYGEAAEVYELSLKEMDQPQDWMYPDQLAELGPASFYAPDNYQAAKHRGDMLLRQAAAEAEAPAADPEAGKGLFLQAAGSYREALAQPTPPGEEVPSAAAANNLSVALLKAGDHEGATEVLEVLAGDSEASEEWRLVPTADERNPVFRMNLGAAYEKAGREKDTAEQYLDAVEGDPTFYPSLNDLGVLAAKEGDLEKARGYFGAALENEPGYEYALHNMGVALIHSGPLSLLAAQSFLADAAREDPALSGSNYHYVPDDELYFLKLSLGEGVPPDWEFVAHAERSAFVVSFVALFWLAFRLLRNYAYSRGRNTVVGKLFEVGRARLGGRLVGLVGRAWDGWLRSLRVALPRPEGPRMTVLAFAVSVPAVVLVQTWPSLRDGSDGTILMLAVMVYVVTVSLLVHHAGHALAARRNRMSVGEAPWPGGIAQALILAVVGGPVVAPMPVTSVFSEESVGKSKDEGTENEGAGGESPGAVKDRQAGFVYLAGVLASVAFAVLLLVLSWVAPIPVFSLGVTVNLALASASLLSLPPLDASMVGEKHYSRWLFWAGCAVTTLSFLVAWGQL